MGTDTATGEGLERELEALLEVERFPPPEEFRRQALVSDWSLHDEAERDLEGFWARQAEELLDWYEKPRQTLNESDAPFYRWFEDGKLNVSYNCLDRHVDAGRATRWRSTGGARRERSARSLTATCTAMCSGSRTLCETAASARETWSASTCR